VPTTRTKRQALFGMEELPWVGGTASAGLRLEHAEVASEGDADPADPKFGAPQKRSFSLRSASLSNVYKLTSTWDLTGALSYTERAPTSLELYANGVHAATGSFERGDATRKADFGSADALWFLKVNNVSDKLAYNASTVQGVRDLAPLPGRSVKAGLRVTF
jgi:iron complex outermembrane receptor protein